MLLQVFKEKLGTTANNSDKVAVQWNLSGFFPCAFDVAMTNHFKLVF